jgi:hypothetical protein
MKPIDLTIPTGAIKTAKVLKFDKDTIEEGVKL